MAKPEIENFGRIADVGLSDIPALADCNCGMEPVEYNLIIAPAEQKERIGSILLADESREKLAIAKQVGRIVAASPLAFTYDAWPEGSRPPLLGDVVWFGRYAGKEYEGPDGRTYRIIKDKDIGAIIDRASAVLDFKKAFAGFGANALTLNDLSGVGSQTPNAFSL